VPTPLMSPRRTRWIAIVALAAYAVAWVGVLPTPEWLGITATKITADSYPCQGGSCACSSAATCWTTCSCQTMREKVRWARRMGAPIPSHVDLAGLDDRPEPACPLCVGHDSDSRTATTEDDEQPARPIVSPIGCGVLQTLLALGIAPVLLPTMPEVTPGPDLGPIPAWTVLAWEGRSLGTEPPPPRCAA